jgi:ElaB/YqjD/DUF883 family membrane-anchored ribosome-binding protein
MSAEPDTFVYEKLILIDGAIEAHEERIQTLFERLETLLDHLGNTTHELERKIDDARNDAERATDSLRDDLKSLEHKVDYS